VLLLLLLIILKCVNIYTIYKILYVLNFGLVLETWTKYKVKVTQTHLVRNPKLRLELGGITTFN